MLQNVPMDSAVVGKMNVLSGEPSGEETFVL
jgi:hypothetical protein